MERALTVTVDFKERDGWTAEERSKELTELASSAGAHVIKEIIVPRDRVDPALFIGKGKAGQIAQFCADEKIKIVIFNNDLSPSQQNNLESIVAVKTIDRTQLILDIFAKRARSNEGKVQVELAQLLYLLPRLIGKGVTLSRLGGGIGTRGPGEQKLEVDRRRIRQRISHLENGLDALKVRRAMMRSKRERFSVLTAAIVGYTNVGKSTLLNALTEAAVVVQDKLFSTLDPTVRRFILPDKQKILFVDTVGFIDHLPHHLIEAFKATLEEVVEADLLLHLVDMSHPKMEEQSKSVLRVLAQIGAHHAPVITVLNKRDRVDDEVFARAGKLFPGAVVISALERIGFEGLADKIMAHVDGLTATVHVRLAAHDTKTLHYIYEHGAVTTCDYEGDWVLVEARVPSRMKEAVEKASVTRGEKKA